MPAANVFVSLVDPDALIAGTDPLAPFVVHNIQVYRYASEAAARADTDGSGGTLLNGGSGYTFLLVASTTARADPDIAGPYRFGFYDSSQASGTWYRLRYANSALDTFTLLSDPWEADNRPSVALRTLLFEAGWKLGQSVRKGTAGTNGTANLAVCTPLFQSTLRDARFFEGWHLLCSYDAGGAGAAPEGEEAQIASVNTDTGTVTLERSLSQSITIGDEVLISAAVPFAEMIRVINEVREKMMVKERVDIALSSGENRYPVPYGVKSETDIIDAVGVRVFSSSNREDEFPIGFRVRFDGTQGWVEIDSDLIGYTNVARLTVLRSYRDIEGPLEDMGDTTMAPIEWLRPACAYAIAQHYLKTDPSDQEVQHLRDILRDEAEAAAGIYAPEVQRRVNTGGGRQSLPGPAEVQ